MTERFARVPIGAAADSRLSKSALRVLIALCAYVDREGRACPTQGQLATGAGIRRQGVNGAMAELRNAGLVVVESIDRDGLGRFGRQRLRVCYGSSDATPDAPVSPQGGHGPCPEGEDMDRVPPGRTAPCPPRADSTVSPPGRTASNSPRESAQEEQPKKEDTRGRAGLLGSTPIDDPIEVLEFEEVEQPKVDATEAEFDALWREYPNKTSGRAVALKAYRSALRKVSAGKIAEALRAYVDWIEHPADPTEFRPNFCGLAVWLNQERWTAELTGYAPARPAGPPSKYQTLMALRDDLTAAETGIRPPPRRPRDSRYDADRRRDPGVRWAMGQQGRDRLDDVDEVFDRVIDHQEINR